MAAYFILDTEVRDPVGYAEYVKAGSPSVEKHGGKYIARGAKVEVLEGDWRPSRIVVIEFPSFDEAKRWYNSPEYQAALSGRLRAAVSKAVIIEGYSPYTP